PAAVGLILLGRPAIALVLQRGAFDETATNLVYGVLIYFSLRVVSEASLEVLARLFYAQHNTLVPMLAAGVWFLSTAPLSYLLVGPLGVGGLALASSLAFTVQSTILFVLNRARLGPLGGRALALGLGRIMLATAGMALVIM